MVVVAVGEDPVVTASTRNRWIYSVLLGFFYIMLALGVIFTGRTLYREARLSRLKTDFVSLVSHELRTPLTSVLGFAKIIKKRLEDRIFPLVPTGDRKVHYGSFACGGDGGAPTAAASCPGSECCS